MAAPYRVRALLLCDFVRREITGKDIIVGVYHTKILVKEFPHELRLSLWANIEPLKPGEHLIILRFVYGKQKRPLVEIEAGIQVDMVAGGASPFSFGPIPVPVPEPGDLKIQHKLPSGRWETLITHAVELRPTVGPTVSELLA